MIVELKLHTKLGYDGSIKWKYIDNAFTKKHKEALIEVTNHYIDPWHAHWNMYPEWTKKWDQNRIDTVTQDLKSSIIELNTIWDIKRGCRWKYPLDIEDVIFKKDDVLENQKLLNDLHRYFTTLQQSLGKIDKYNHGWASYHWTRDEIVQKSERLYSGTKKLWLRKYFSEAAEERGEFHPNILFFEATMEATNKIMEHIQAINDNVHKIEKYIKTPNKLEWKQQYKEFLIEFQPHRLIEFTPNDRKYLTYKPGPTVWYTQNQILGKSYPIAFCDHDDPNQHDIWEGTQYSGSFAFGDRSYVEWPPFKEWMEGIDIPLGIPLGHIIEGEDIVPTLTPGSIKNIIIHQD